MSGIPIKVDPEDAPFPLTDVDKWILSLTDEEYQYHGWEDVKKIIEENNLSVLKRKPSDLRRYMKWTAEIKIEYGSMSNYLMKHRLPKVWGSPPFKPASTTPFEDSSDYRVLINDWPYGMMPNMTHIVVWSRTTIPTDPETGDMTTESRDTVKNFVKMFFVDKLGPAGDDKVLWFKNWVALQSVRALERMYNLDYKNFIWITTYKSEMAGKINILSIADLDAADIHIIVRDVDKDTLDKWTEELDCHRLLN